VKTNPSKSVFIQLLVGICLIVATQGLVNAQERPLLTEEQLRRLSIRPVPDKAGLYLLPGFDGNMSGGNVLVLVTDEGVMIVDNKFTYSHANIIGQSATVTHQPVKYVLNTHHHFDHAGSNADFLPDAQIIAHRNVRTNILRNNQSGPPNVIFDESAAVILGGQEVQALHFGRGHTNGDSVIFFRDLGVVHTGDLFIWGDRLDSSTLVPFIDYDNGGSAAEWSATLDGLLALDFDTVIPGHGPILRKVDVRVFQSKFDRLVSQIRILIGEGVSRDDIVSVLDIADLRWPLARARVQSIYDELAALEQ
jgi:cyclase